jgi:hypothetical protein
MRLQKQQSFLAVSCVACVVIVLRNTKGLEGTEFSGGWLTGRLLSMADIGAVLFVLALIGTLWTPRIAEVLGLAASLLCVPLHLYLVAPVMGWPSAAVHESRSDDNYAVAGLMRATSGTWPRL